MDRDEDSEPNFAELTDQDRQVMQAAMTNPSEAEDEEDQDDNPPSIDYDTVIHGVRR